MEIIIFMNCLTVIFRYHLNVIPRFRTIDINYILHTYGHVFKYSQYCYIGDI